MIRVYLDGERIPTERVVGKNAVQILAEVRSGMKDCVVQKVAIDGREVVPADGVGDLAGAREMSIETKPTREVLLEAMQELLGYLPRLERRLMDTSGYLRFGWREEGHRKLGRCLGGLEWCMVVLARSIELAGERGLEDEFRELNEDLNRLFTLLNRTLAGGEARGTARVCSRIERQLETIGELAGGILKVQG